jgi:hypothetical protein
MKFSVDIDCTPEEARAFFGLPSVEAFNKAMMEEIQKQTLAQIRAMDPAEVAKTWMPMGAKAWEQFQQMFAAGMGTTSKSQK